MPSPSEAWGYRTLNPEPCSMSDQADLLRKLVRETVESRPSLAPGLPIIVFTGGTEGVGTSSVVWQVAQELLSLGKRPLVVDANLQRPSFAEKAGIEPQQSLSDVLNGKTSVKEALTNTPESIQLLTGKPVADSPPEMNRPAVTRLLRELRSLNAFGDVVLVDNGSGMSPWTQSWWRASQQVFLLTTVSEDSIKSAYATVKLSSWGDADGKLKLIINRCDHEESARRITESFAATCRRFLGVCVGEAAPIPDRETSATAHHRAIRLLATEIVSESLVTNDRIAAYVPKTNRLPALPEELAHSAKQAQHTDQ